MRLVVDKINNKIGGANRLLFIFGDLFAYFDNMARNDYFCRARQINKK
jgi:hypothetical protein